MKTSRILWIGLVILGIGCGDAKKLPILGNRTPVTKTVNGETIIDTIYQTLPKFSFVNQYGEIVDESILSNKIIIADFFFTSCPTICPIMKKQMLQVYEAIKGKSDFLILSHTIDPEFDTVEVLKDYATRLGVDDKQWLFLTGKKEEIYSLAEKGYYASVAQDSSEPGGYVHSGGFILVDKQQRVRWIYDGTNEQEVKQLINDLQSLVAEK
ncbi:MAG: SCO family protein [Bacteroidia bacterium]|jgi:protein SCO1/2|nr:SCO family protein [Bacteroidia bacterium]